MNSPNNAAVEIARILLEFEIECQRKDKTEPLLPPAKPIKPARPAKRKCKKSEVTIEKPN